MVYHQYCVRYQVLYWLLQCVLSFLTKTHRARFTISSVLGIRYCIGYCNGSHHSVLRCMKHALPSVIYQVLYQLLQCIPSYLIRTHKAWYTLSTVLGIRNCTGYFSVSNHSLLTCMKNVLPSVIYQVLGIVLPIITYPIVPH